MEAGREQEKLFQDDRSGIGYRQPAEAELMAKGCHVCWFRFGRYIPRQGDICPKCGEQWKAASVAVMQHTWNPR